MRRLRLLITGVIAVLAVQPSVAVAGPFPTVVALPADFQPEGIAVGSGSTFYVGSLRSGDIYRGDLRTGSGGIFVAAPPGRAAVGLKADQTHGLLFVAGGGTGAAYVYDLWTGAPVADYQFGTPGVAFLNDVTVTRNGAYFTNTFEPVMYEIPFALDGTLGQGRVIALSGPAAQITESFNLNGIAATADGSTLFVNHTALGALFAINPVSGASTAIAVEGILPGTPDGLLFTGRDLWVVENFANTVVRVTLSPDFTSGTITQTITSPLFHVPTTVARFGDRLAFVNGRFDLGFPPPFGPGAPPGTTFDVAVVGMK